MKKLKWSLLFSFFALNAFAAERTGTLGLAAFVPGTSRTNVTELKISGKQALYLLSSQVNSDVLLESQKIEIEGEDQAGVQAHLKKVMTSNRTIQYQLLINRLQATTENFRPIILKISAN